jgi:hypothetical protein
MRKPGVVIRRGPERESEQVLLVCIREVVYLRAGFAMDQSNTCGPVFRKVFLRNDLEARINFSFIQYFFVHRNSFLLFSQ